MDDKDFSDLSHRTKNIVRAFSIRGPVNAGVLRQCLSQVSQLHPLLKVRFIRGKDRVYLQVSKGKTVCIYCQQHMHVQWVTKNDRSCTKLNRVNNLTLPQAFAD